MVTVYLGLGSNLGDRSRNLRSAIQALESNGLTNTTVSPVYETQHVGETTEPIPDYLNCVVRGETSLSADDILKATQTIEKALGRSPTYRWGPRVIDIDLLLYGDVSVESDRLTLPHPRMRDRMFVLKPLHDLDPGLVLPRGEIVAELLSRPELGDQSVRRFGSLS